MSFAGSIIDGINNLSKQIVDGVNNATQGLVAMASSKITKTSTGQYDQIFALSQGYLNKSFKALWDSLEDSHELRDFKTHNVLGSITSTIGPPELVLDVADDNKYVIFNINIVTGKLILIDIESGDPVANMPTDGFDMAGCTISFKVGITGELIDRKANPDVNERIHEDADNYSLTRLYVDLTTANLTNFNESSSKLPPGVLESNGNWMHFFNTWMLVAQHSKTPMNTLGYALTSLDPKTPPKTIAPTFAPTFNEFQTCEWRSETDNKTVLSGIPDGDNNCLLYLQMTQHKDEPKPLFYSYTGNLVNAGESGSLLISKDLFWNTWLLPQLLDINFKTWMRASHAHCSNNEVEPDWEFGWKVGADAAAFENRIDKFDPFYAWKPKSTDGNGPYGFTFAPGENRWDDHGGLAASQLSCDIECSNSNEITFTPGSDKIVVSGAIYTRVARWTTAARAASVEITLNWSFSIQMKEISSVDATSPGLVPGGLTVVLGDENIPTEAHKEGHSDWGSAQTTPDGAANDIVKAVKTMDIEQIAKDIVGGISGLGHFVLPGNGTFKMTNPMFNNNGDLLCHLEYLPTATS